MVGKYEYVYLCYNCGALQACFDRKAIDDLINFNKKKIIKCNDCGEKVKLESSDFIYKKEKKKEEIRDEVRKMEKMLEINDLIKFTGLTRKTFLCYIRSGKLPFINMNRSGSGYLRYGFSPETIVKFFYSESRIYEKIFR